ncbi:MAG TPA: phage head closure protein [Tepidisphaeraceae bacterium]|nr:phage head closure protein [Tepidisphaeraceae bacterium]
MSIPAGELNQWITLKRTATAVDTRGEVRESHQDSIRVRAKVETEAQPESIENGTTTPLTKFTFKIRHRKDVQPDWKIDYRGQLLDISSIADPPQTRIRLVIVAYAPHP